jgi:hypothetical protein
VIPLRRVAGRHDVEVAVQHDSRITVSDASGDLWPFRIRPLDERRVDVTLVEPFMYEPSALLFVSRRVVGLDLNQSLQEVSKRFRRMYF